MRESSADPSRLIAALARDQVFLDLKTIDLCFLAGLHLRADRGSLVSFDEELLLDMFEQVCDVVEPGAENPRKRATHAIQRLREQRMLTRVDGAGVVRAGEYALTRLAAAVVEYFLADEALTRESLTLLTGVLRAQLAEILAAAKKAEDPQGWRSGVSEPLRVTVAELISGIERRQRGLDAQQEEVQTEIAKLLAADWFGAIDQCQTLLEASTDTLQELNTVLLRDTHQFVALLQDIQTLAAAALNPEAEQTAQRVIEHVDRIAAWGGERQRAWSGYYQYVHRFLRDVVRLDPGRALSQRLRDQLAGWPVRPFQLVVVREPSIRLLRPLETRVERPPVVRQRRLRDEEPEWVEPLNFQKSIEVLVEQAIKAGATKLSEVAEGTLPGVAEPLHYVTLGRITGVVGRRARVRVEHERPWANISDHLEIEDWGIGRG